MPKPEITYKPSLKKRTTLRLGGTAIAEVALGGEAHFEHLPGLLADLGGKPIVLGRGSNILAQDGNLPLVLLRLEATESPALLTDERDYALLAVSGALPLPLFLCFAAEQGLGGLEGLAGIPGTVGGAIAMNAGSFNSEIGDCLEELEIFTPESGLVRKGLEEISPSYRSFTFTGQSAASWYIIRKAIFKLPRKEKTAINASMQEVIQKKAATQPLNFASAGCTFKNPAPDAPAGMLLEKCGFKGKIIGGMAFSHIHANFLVNQHNGNSSQAMELIAAAKDVVRTEFGYELELEVKVIA